jgi:exonuclease SbcD
MESFRFIHESATLGALDRVVDHTIDSKADFLVIAGDVYDSKDRSLRALVSFRKQMERLAARHIPVFIGQGKHAVATRIRSRSSGAAARWRM